MAAKTRLPQNVQALIGEVGEKQVLLQLALRVHGKDWEVFHNVGEAGYDILLLNPDQDKRVRIEVKTRQRLSSTDKRTSPVHFRLTDGEYKVCDFLVAYFIDHNAFYIVPQDDLKKAQSKGKTYWRFILPLTKQGEPRQDFDEYRDAWSSIDPDLRLAGDDKETSDDS